MAQTRFDSTGGFPAVLPLIHQILFFVFAVITGAFGLWGFYRLYLRIRRGAPATERRFDVPGRRILDAVRVSLTQERTFRRRTAISVLHSFIFYGFVFYLLVNVVDGLEGYLSSASTSDNFFGAAYNLLADVLSFLVLFGVVALVVRRLFTPSKRDFRFTEKTLLHPLLKNNYILRDSLIVSAFIFFHVGSRVLGNAAKVVAEGGDAFQYVLGASSLLHATLTYNNMDSAMTGSVFENDYHARPGFSLNTFTYRKDKTTRESIVWEGETLPNGQTTVTLFGRQNDHGQLPSYTITGCAGSTCRGTENNNHVSSVGVDVKHQQDFEFLTSRLVAGIYIDRSNNGYWSNNLAITRDLATGRYVSYVASALQTGVRNYQADINNTALFAQYEISPLEELRVVAGGRSDSISYKFTNNLTPGANYGAPNETRSFSHFSPKLGATYASTQQSSIYTNISQGFTPPEVSQLYSISAIPDLTAATYNNYELGARIAFLEGALKLDSAIYRLDGHDTILNYTVAPGNSVNKNAGRTRSQGLELGLNWSGERFDARFGTSISSHRFQQYKVSTTLDYSGKEMPAAPSNHPGREQGPERRLDQQLHGLHVDRLRRQHWDDHQGRRPRRSEYKGMIALNGDPTQASAGYHGVVMASLANGGSADNIAPGVDFFKKLNDSGNLLPVDPTPATIASGQTPCVIDWEYNNAAQTGRPRWSTGIDWKVVIPTRRAAGRRLLPPGHQQGRPAPGGRPPVDGVPLLARRPNGWLKGFARPATLMPWSRHGHDDKTALDAAVRRQRHPRGPDPGPDQDRPGGPEGQLDLHHDPVGPGHLPMTDPTGTPAPASCRRDTGTGPASVERGRFQPSRAEQPLRGADPVLPLRLDLPAAAHAHRGGGRLPGRDRRR